MVKKQRKHEEEGHGGGGMERWLLTYADLITLLLIMFIVLYAMSKIDAKKFEELKSALGILFSGTSPFEDTVEGGKQEGTEIRELKYRKPVVGQKKLGNRLNDFLIGELSRLQLTGLKIVSRDKGILITIPAEIYFKPGTSQLNKNAYKVLDILQILFQRESLKNTKLSIEGHTDNTAPDNIDSENIISNWDLGYQRAITVLKFFEAHGISPKRLSATTFGETKPIINNENQENRADNRRVDIHIETKK